MIVWSSSDSSPIMVRYQAIASIRENPTADTIRTRDTSEH